MPAPMPNEKSLSPEPSLTDSLHRSVASTVDTGESTQSTSFTMQQPAIVGLPLDQHYQIGAEIARGGMGVVHRAIDLAFKREVAVKTLLPKWEKEKDPQRQEQRKAQMIEAFRYEAEITARLQHPGIPPVHELGRQSNHLPFLAMKLIHGQTLQALLQPRTALLAELPRWLQIFEQISQAVGYAHSQRILHRDLKPANIMVGEFGEVQVMDWGLAKIVGAAEPAGIDFSGDDELTSDARQFVSRVGDIKGTLAYMPPEQARGEVNELDPRADVFGLGAILCEILTGSPPYTGRTVNELRQQAAAGELSAVFESLRRSGGDAEIVELAIACLSPNPADRPFDGTTVAESIAAHRASVEQRLRRAETERALSKQQLVEQGRRRKLWLGIAAALLLLTVVSSSLAIVYARSNSIIADRETKAKNAATLAKQREGEANTAKLEAFKQEKIAVDKAAISDEVNNFLLNDLLAQASTLTQAASGMKVDPNMTVRDLVLRSVTRIEGRFEKQPKVEAEVRYTMGRTLLQLGESKAAVRQFERVQEIYSTLLDDEQRLLSAKHFLGEAYVAAGEFEKGVAIHVLLREKVLASEGPTAPKTMSATNSLANAYRGAGKLDRALELYEELLQTQIKSLGADHPATMETKHNLAMALRAADQLDKAIPILEETVRQMEKLNGQDHPDTLGAISNLALAYRSAGKWDKALPLYERALEGRANSLGEDHPLTISSLNNLGVAFSLMGDAKRALPIQERVLKYRQEKFGPDDVQTLEAMNNLAITLQDLGQLQRALSLAEQALKTRLEKLGEEHPQTLGSLYNVGNIYTELGDYKKAIPLLEKAVKLRSATLGERHSETIKAKQGLSVTYCNAEEFAKALPLLEELLPLSVARVGDKHPDTVITKNNLATAYHGLGQFERAANLREEVLNAASQAFGPNDFRTMGSMLNLAMTEIPLKRYEQAEKHLQKVWNDSERAPQQQRRGMRVAIAQEFIKLYEGWDKPDDVKKWEAELRKLLR